MIHAVFDINVTEVRSVREIEIDTASTTETVHTPADWQVVKLGSLAAVTRGASPRPIDDPRWFDDQSRTGWLRISDATATDKYLDRTVQNLSNLGIANSRFVKEGSLVMSICATVGRPIITRKDVCIHDGFVVFDNLQAHNEYIYYVLTDIENNWAKKGQTGSQMNLNTDLIASTTIPLPPANEQRTIAEALSDVDGLLESLELLITKKQAIKQATMQQLLTGKTRLPEFGGTWERMALGEISDIKNGSTPSTRISAYWNGRIPWCTPTDITDIPGKYLLATERSIAEEGLASCAASLLPVGALLLCSRATIGEIKIAGLQVCTNQGFKSLVCKDGVSNEFLYYLLKTLKPKLIERAIGSTFLEIGKREVTSIEVNLPPHDEQCAIAAVLSDMDTEIASLEQRRDKTRALKQGMMQQLLTGRIRLARPL